MKNILWTILAFILSRRPIANAIIRRAKRTPYSHITGRNSDDVYMRRWWVFNPNKDVHGDPITPRWPRLPSIRVHEILRADDDSHPHDHPWQARTIVLKGWYAEQRPIEFGDHSEVYRDPGYTGPIIVGMFHRITDVSNETNEPTYWLDPDASETCTTLFCTWGEPAPESWGFLVNGEKVHWRTYLGLQ